MKILCLLGLVGVPLFAQEPIPYEHPPTADPATAQPGAVQPSGETTQAPAAHPTVSLRVVGSNLMNPQGQYLGRIEEVLLNQANQIEFALVQSNFPTNDNMLTAVPWSMLSYVWDQSKAGGTPGAVQTFLAPLDKAKLEQAPKISRKGRTDLSPDWAQRVYAFYGGSPGAIGAAGSGAGSIAGAGSSAAMGGAGVPAGVAAGVGAADAGYYGYPGYAYGGVGGSFITNTVFPTNVIVNSNFVSITNVFGSNVFAQRTNFFRDRTNFFANRTNFFRDRTNFMAGNTNFPQNGLAVGSNINVGRRQLPGNVPAEMNQGNVGGTGNTGGTSAGQGAGGGFSIIPVNPNVVQPTTRPSTIPPPSAVAPPGTVAPPASANPPGTIVPQVPGGSGGIFTPGTPATPGSGVVGGSAAGAGAGGAGGGAAGGGR